MRADRRAAWLATLTLGGLGGAVSWALTGLPATSRPTAPAGASSAAPTGSAEDILKRDVGVWDATIQITTDPQGVLEVYNGTETNTLVPGGLWLLSDFESRLNGAPFEGHGVLGYDRTTKKYTRIWVDSTQPTYWPSEGTYDPATGTLTLWTQATDSAGQVVRWKTVTTWKDQDTRTFTMYVPGPEDTEAAGMTITYKRRK